MDINQLTNQQPVKNNGEWKNIITIIFLVIFTPIGLILMWTISSWAKKVKVVTTIVLLLLTLLAVFLLSITAVTSFKEASYKASDARIIFAISTLRTQMAYFEAIEESLDNFNCQHREVQSFCEDIVNSGSEPQIIKNSMNNQACIYAKVQAKENQWYCADTEGNAGYVTVNPQSNGYCVKGAVNVSCPPY